MAEVRRHMTRSHRDLDFLRLCSTCNDDFLDRNEFESSHGYKGELCINPQEQRRAEGQEEQWTALYKKVDSLNAIAPVELRKFLCSIMGYT